MERRVKERRAVTGNPSAAKLYRTAPAQSIRSAPTPSPTPTTHAQTASGAHHAPVSRSSHIAPINPFGQ
eukprot:3718417-Prymnesium_polylepis.1